MVDFVLKAIDEHPFLPIFSPLKALLLSSPEHIRLNVLKCFVWILHEERRKEEIVELMLFQMRSGSLSRSMTANLIKEWVARIHSLPQTSICAILLDVLEKWIATVCFPSPSLFLSVLDL